MAATPVTDKRAVMQAAMQAQGQQGQGAPPQGGAPPQAMPQGAPPQGAAPQGGPQPMTSNTAIGDMMGTGVDLSQDPQAITGIVQMLQDPGLPPDQRAELQMRLQLAALSSLQGSGPSGAAGGQGS